jgi:hypothetical protein
MALAFSFIAYAQTAGGSQAAQNQTAASSSPDDPHNISGIWFIKPLPGHVSIVNHEDLQEVLDSKQRPPMTPWAQERYKNNIPHGGPRYIAGKENDPILRCYPDGVPKVLSVPMPIEIIQIPGRILINYEIHSLRREIWTDGRELPKDPEPAYMGYSIGRWEGDTLVIESNGFNDITWLDFDGSPHSEDLHVTERYRRLDHNTLELTVSLEDPKAYTKPWVGNKPVTFGFKPNWQLMEHFCIMDEEKNYEDSLRIPAGGGPVVPTQNK